MFAFDQTAGLTRNTGSHQLYDHFQVQQLTTHRVNQVGPLCTITLLHFTVQSLSRTTAESQKPRQRVSNADRKVFANPESFCDKFIIG